MRKRIGMSSVVGGIPREKLESVSFGDNILIDGGSQICYQRATLNMIKNRQVIICSGKRVASVF